MGKIGETGAIELSIGTIVILVIAMTMLILGIVLVKEIFGGAKYNVKEMNEKVRDKINKLFVEDKKAVIYLPNRIAEIKQGEQWGIGFGIQNNMATQKFFWRVEVDDARIREKCGVTELQAEKWITTGGEGSVDLTSGESHIDVMRFNIPEGAVDDISSCIVRYHLIVEKEDKTNYITESFDIDIQ